MIPVEPCVARLETRQAAHEHRRADEEHEGEGHLKGDEEAADGYASVASPGHGAAARAQRGRRVDAGDAKGGQEAEQQHDQRR